MAQLAVYKKTAPHYSQIQGLLQEILSKPHSSIVSLNKAAIETVCAYLNIKNQISIFSDMSLATEQPLAPDEWALNICKAVGGVEEYWNPPGGEEFF